MKEIEVKFLNIDPKEIAKKLKRLGAKKILSPTLFKEIYFTHPNLKKKYFSSIRVRLEGKEVVITVKKAVSWAKYKTEEEFEILSNGTMEDACLFLEAMGFKKFREREKVREEYKLDKTKVDIDHYPKMMPFMEIEGPNGTSIRLLAKKLGLDMKNAISSTSTEVIREVGLNPNKLLFGRR